MAVGSDAQRVFEKLKEMILTAPILGYSNPNKRSRLDTDASAFGVEEVLSQEQDRQEKVVSYYSKYLNLAVPTYCLQLSGL